MQTQRVDQDVSKRGARELIECQRCFNTLEPHSHLFVCDSGHSYCSKCELQIRHEELHRCETCEAICEVRYDPQRQQSLQNMAFPCRYAEHGCDLLAIWKEHSGHEPVCSYRPFQCPFECGWWGIHPEDHLTRDHDIPTFEASWEDAISWVLALERGDDERGDRTWSIVVNVAERATANTDPSWFLFTADQEHPNAPISIQIRSLNFVGRFIATLRIDISATCGAAEFSWRIPSLRAKKQRAMLPKDIIQNAMENDPNNHNGLQLMVSISKDETMEEDGCADKDTEEVPRDTKDI